MTIRVGLNVHPDDDFRALLPLVLADDAVEALEWSWEIGTPAWLLPLCDLFAAHDALTVHLVQYPLNGDPAIVPRVLERVRRECAQRRPRHLTAHYGVTAARGFRTIAPLPPLPCKAAAREAGERLARLREAAGCPVGVENLGIAFSRDDVLRQAEMVHAILAGDPEHFLLLDVHNLYCQAINYQLSPVEILSLYPLERVREMHVSGGSWWQAGAGRFRRDTHDQAVPDEVLELLSLALPAASGTELICFERMGGTLPDDAAREETRADYRRVVATVAAAGVGAPISAQPPRELDDLVTPSRELERGLVEILSSETEVERARARLCESFTAHAAWLRAIDPRALEAAMAFERRWARRA